MPSPVKRTQPLEHGDYLKLRDDVVRFYTTSIGEYDRLVTWASGGALALSITFLEKFGQGADRGTAWLLGVGWILLASAFAASLWSQYCSSRIHSWTMNELDHLQIARDDRDSESWVAEAVRLNRIVKIYGKATKWLTFMSGVLLVGGIMSVAVFAFLNAPFKSAENASNPPRTAAVPVPEKKGSEHIPEPVPRPQSTPPKVPPPEKR